LEHFHELSKESLKNRFLSYKKGLSKSDLKLFTEVDYINHFAFALLVEEKGLYRPIGSTRFIIDDHQKMRAEVAVTVIDKYQRKGMGMLLFGYLVKAAKEKGVQYFYATANADNIGIFKLLSHFGSLKKSNASNGFVEICLELSNEV
jgi:GNAT superfamily N-acetyltransferase